MEKLEREKWESESKAHKWKMDFQDLCQTYEVTGCNKATLYYMSALQLREQIQDNALKRLFIYAICDAGFLMDRYTDCKEQQMETSFRNTEKRMRKLLTLLQKEKEMCEQWSEIVGRKRFSSKTEFILMTTMRNSLRFAACFGKHLKCRKGRRRIWRIICNIS